MNFFEAGEFDSLAFPYHFKYQFNIASIAEKSIYKSS